MFIYTKARDRNVTEHNERSFRLTGYNASAEMKLACLCNIGTITGCFLRFVIQILRLSYKSNGLIKQPDVD